MTTAKKATAPKADEPKADEKLVTFIPAETFTGWPEDYKSDRPGVIFTAGVESVPVPQSYADLMREKGLVVEKETTTADAGERSLA